VQHIRSKRKKNLMKNWPFRRRIDQLGKIGQFVGTLALNWSILANWPFRSYRGTAGTVSTVSGKEVTRLISLWTPIIPPPPAAPRLGRKLFRSLMYSSDKPGVRQQESFP
jgi:hypothetical protein